jgi:hypothetical protein
MLIPDYQSLLYGHIDEQMMLLSLGDHTVLPNELQEYPHLWPSHLYKLTHLQGQQS